MEPVYSVARAALLTPLGHGLRWTFEGAHRVPTFGPVILASNHISYLDPLVLAYLADRRHRKVRFLAKAELFEKTGLGWGLRQMKQIPVERNSEHAATSLDAGVEALRAGECVVVFPEGTISPDLEPMAARTGTARLAASSGVPVTPVGLWGAHRILFKGRKPKWRRGVAETVVVGDPVPVAADEDAVRRDRPDHAGDRGVRRTRPSDLPAAARATTKATGGCGRPRPPSPGPRCAAPRPSRDARRRHRRRVVGHGRRRHRRRPCRRDPLGA